MKKKILHLRVKQIYYEQVLYGEKKEEYRELKPYWSKRLNQTYDEIHYHSGYKRKDLDMFIRFKWSGYRVGKITHELFGKNIPVYIIPLKQRIYRKKKAGYT